MQRIRELLSRKDIKKTIIYRILSISSEFIIVYFVTGNLEAPTIITGACLVFHTGFYYLVERRWQ